VIGWAFADPGLQMIAHRPADDFSREGVETFAAARHQDQIIASPRQFSRAFRSETGQSPAKAVENLRVEAARMLMEQGRHSMDVIANETGFADRERLRRAFLRTLGTASRDRRALSARGHSASAPRPGGAPHERQASHTSPTLTRETKMKTIGVGVIGASPLNPGWAMASHIPALKASADIVLDPFSGPAP
jgi:AraC-like DNA-binding protein